jgi:Bacterial Ig-like domain (group 3)
VVGRVVAVRQVCCLLVALLAALAIPAGASAATPTTTTVSSSKNPSAVGQSVTYTATVNPAPDGGTVAFVDNGVPIAGCEARGPNTVNGETTCSATYGVNGTHSITATYSGNANFSGSSSSTLTQVVGSAGPTTSITKSTIRPKTKSATFKFTAAGATGFQCALIKKGKNHKSKPHFSSCASPKRYKHLKHGKYTFEVRAVTAAGSGPIAKKSFKV